MKISDLKKSIREMIVAELSEGEAYEITSKSGNKTTQTFPNSTEANKFKASNSNISNVKKLEEDANITGDLKLAMIDAFNNNKKLDGKDLGKAIKSDDNVKIALAASGEKLHPNQLNRFIAKEKGELELGQRGRKPNSENVLAKKMAELESQEKNLLNRLNKITLLKKELESLLGTNKIDKPSVNENKYKYLAEKYQLDEEVINEMASIKQLKQELKKQGKEEELNAVEDAEKTTLNNLKKDPTITSDGRLKGYVSAFKKELKGTHGIDLQNLLNKTKENSKNFNASISTNTIEKDAANTITGKEKLKPGPISKPEVAARRSEEEKAKEAKRAEKEKARAEKERAKAPAQKPTFPTYKKTTTMVDMSGEPSDKDIAKAEKELGIDIPKVKKPSKLSAEEKDKFDIALKGITAKVNRIKNREAKPDDLTLLKKAYGDEGIKKLFKKAGENLDDLVAGIIGGGDTGEDLIPDELT